MNPDEDTTPSAPRDATQKPAPEASSSANQPVTEPSNNETNTAQQAPPQTTQVEPNFDDTISPESSEPAVTTQPEAVAEATAESPEDPDLVNATSTGSEMAPVEPTADDPGRTMGVVGIVLAFLLPLIGLVVSIKANLKSKKAGHKNSLARAGIVIATIMTILSLVFAAYFVLTVNKTIKFCNENGPGIHTTEDGLTITCDKKT